jgi:multiple sugar transport system substrate-binding protein
MRVRAGAAFAGLVLLSACGTAGGGDGDGREVVTYWLWGADQQPGYQQCAEDFEAAHPDIDIQISQIGWEDYWNNLNLAFVAESAPDVFTDHVAKYPDFVTRDLLLPLDDFVERDDVPLDVYEEGLAELWLGEDGRRYGLPKDWDTIAIFYNRDKLREAGLSEREMGSLSWNPEDGGTYEDVIAHLTVDENGVRGDEPGFDKNHVATYGLWLDARDGVATGFGQTQWSMYTGSTGWTDTDTNPWGRHFNYDDPRFQDTIGWWRGLIEKGYMPSLAEQEGVQWSDQLAAGTAAMATSGSWMISAAYGYEGLDVGLAPTPVGPSGERASMFNGLADSITAGTDSPEEAWEWVKYLGSMDCQRVVAEKGVVFPAITEAWEIKQANYAEEGIDVSPFTTQVEDGTTFPFPIAENPADITAEMTRTMESVLNGASLDSFDGMNRRVNALFSP